MEFVKSSNHRMLERSVAEAVAYKLIKTQSGETSTKQIRITRPMLLDSPKPFENCFLLRKSKKYRFSLTRQPSLNDHQKHPHDATPMALEWCEASSLPVINYLELLGLNYPSASSASTFLNYTSATPTIKKKIDPYNSAASMWRCQRGQTPKKKWFNQTLHIQRRSTPSSGTVWWTIVGKSFNYTHGNPSHDHALEVVAATLEALIRFLTMNCVQ